MSHYSQIKTMIKDKEVLLQCLSELGYDVKMNKQSQRGRSPYNADMSILLDGHNIRFGLNADNSYDMIADWDLIGNGVQRKFIESLMQRYAVKTIIAQTNQQGFNIIEHTQEADGSIRIVVRRWV